ncbi:MAG: YraN family protein [Actinomycetota bacterium]
MGLGHVPQEPIRSARTDSEFQGRQRRRTSSRGPSGTDLSRQDLGTAGEDLALQWYLAHDYELIDRNWRCRAGEIDLIVARGGILVVSEVKSRSSHYFGTPGQAVDVDKQRRLRRLAALWLADNRCGTKSVRFDVVEVVFAGSRPEINVIEGAF